MTTNADDVWRLLGELIEAQKETERLLKEQSQESDSRSETLRERRFREQSQESDSRSETLRERRFRETERIIKQQNEKLNQELGKLGNRLGEFVE
ncbi:hypothetical protein H6G58_23720, partial [Arthrospira platensis FACHB-971]|nr:hypothetical protein [Arthrospira platensis FACHB-971]